MNAAARFAARMVGAVILGSFTVLVLVGVILAVAGCASPPAAAHDDPHPGSLQIIEHHCDDNGAIDDIVIHSDGAGTVGLRWNNVQICGTPT